LPCRSCRRRPEPGSWRTLPIAPKAWDKIAQQEADRNPFFKKVYESQRRWAADVVTSRRTVHPSYEVAADYYWPRK
jgi:hypothetical protein